MVRIALDNLLFYSYTEVGILELIYIRKTFSGWFDSGLKPFVADVAPGNVDLFCAIM
jgi:hypothetical protein